MRRDQRPELADQLRVTTGLRSPDARDAAKAAVTA